MIRRSADRARSRRFRLAAPAGLLVILTALACGDSTEPRRAVALGVVTQPPSTAQSGVALAQTVVVEVRDQEGAPFAQSGVSVTASIADGGGTLGGTTTQTTDAAGRAAFPDLVISGTVGPRTLRFSAEGLTAATSTSITLGPGPAAALEAVSATTVQATVNTAVSTLPSVGVKDASGNGVPGVSVTFAIASGGGTVTGTTQSTNASGVATLAGWTLPTTAGQYALTASAVGVAGSVTFTATANPDAPNAMHPSGGGQSALYGSRLATPLQVRVVDQYGNLTPGVVVTWGSVTGLGTAEPIDVATNAEGVARSNYRLGTTPGANVVRASISSRSLSVDFPATARGFTSQIEVGPTHSCALDDDGVAYCWGKNEFSQIGDGTTSNRNVPTPVGGALRFRRISVGNSVTCALTTADVPYCWGSNSYGALGDGTMTDRSVPTPVAGGFRFTAITTSGLVSCGIAGDGTFCWGLNENGLLGTGNIPVDECYSRVGNGFRCSQTPRKVAGGHTFTAISAATSHVCGLTSAQELYCWGWGASWGGPATVEFLPLRAAAGFTFAQITTGESYTCGVVAPSSPYCWGTDTRGELGIGVTGQQVNTPTAVANNLAVLRMDASVWGTCAVATDGRGFCWGYNDAGAVGDGTTGGSRNTPAAVASAETFTAISGSGYHSCGRVASGQAYCWGNNTVGALGNGGGPNQPTPVLVRP